MDPGELLTRAHAQASAILRERFGGTLQLGPPIVIKDVTRALVARAQVVHAEPAPSSVVLKIIRADPATGFSEWASLAFLATLPATRELVPGFIGGALEPPLFLMDDLGAGRTLDEVLTVGGPGEVERALQQLGRQMARLHTTTARAEERFLRLRRGLPGAAMVGRSVEATRWLDGVGRAMHWFAAVGCDLPAGFDACLTRIVQCYREPGPWLSFTHGDPAPSNVHLSSAGVRLVDFEYGDFRHALYDITGWAVLCPLPERLLQLIRATFRTTLAEGVPIAGDEPAFRAAWGALCAYRALALLSWVAPTVLEADRPLLAGWSARQAVLAAAARAADGSAPVPELRPLAEAFTGLQRALHGRWPELGDHGTAPTPWPDPGSRPA